MRTFLRRSLSLGPHAGSIFVLEAAKRAAGIRDHDIGRPLIGCRSIVFVCHGNILRSPFAAGLLAKAVGQTTARYLVIQSAGLRARPGRQADRRGLEAADAHGVSLDDHHARLLTRDIVRHADAIVAMDFQNHADFIARFPGARAKLRLLGAFDPSPERPSLEIEDPYLMGAAGVRRCYEDIARCIDGLCTATAFESWMHVQMRSPARLPATTSRSPARARSGADAAHPSAR